MNKMLAGAALALVLAVSPAHSAMQVTDTKAIAMAAANSAKEVAQLLNQVQQLRHLLDISTLANAVLGPGVAAGWGEFFNATQELYSEINETIALTHTIPATIDGQLAVFSPPTPGTGVGGYLQKFKQIQSMLSKHNTTTLALQSQLIKANNEAAKRASEQGRQVLKAKGQMEVMQLSGVMLGNVSTQLSGLQTTLSDMDNREAIKDLREEMAREQRNERHRASMEELRAMIDRGPRSLSQSPIYWGR